MNDPGNLNAHSASDAALGYLYQCRHALLEALKAVRCGEMFTLHLETLDDVVLSETGSDPAVTLQQLKHHNENAANLTNASADLWKTLRIWSEGFSDGEFDSDDKFHLVTTSKAGVDSAASFLRAVERDEANAEAMLLSTARSSTSEGNQKAYEAFKKLDGEERKQLISAITIFDNAPTIADLDSLIRVEVRWAVEERFSDAFVTRLEGWWFRRCIEILQRPRDRYVLSEEIDSRMGELREQFKRDALPVDDNVLQFNVDVTEYEDAVFCEQLRLIGIGPMRLMIAVREYYRAFEHRSRWQREELLLVGELGKYERKLVEEWQIQFERMREEVGDDATDEAKKQAAKTIYAWVEESSFPLRPAFHEQFFTRGSYQILADRLEVGWHPEFKARLKHLFEGGEAA